MRGRTQPTKTEHVESIGRAMEMLFRLNASRKVHARQAAAAGVVISQPGFVLMRRIQENGPVALGELARLAHMDPAATGRQIRQLEDDGLVQREGSEDDGRVTVVRLTSRGLEVYRRITEVRDRHMDEVLGRWSAADRAQLARLMARLVDDLRSEQYPTMSNERTA